MDTVTGLERLAALLEKGLLSRQEFEDQKALLLRVERRDGVGESPESVPSPSVPPPPTGVAPHSVSPSEPSGARQAAHVRPGQDSSGCWLLMLLGVAGAGALSVAIIFVVAAIVSGEPIAFPSIPRPMFRVSDVVVDQSCSQWDDYCVRVSCRVSNNGTLPGIAHLEVQLFQDGHPPSIIPEPVVVTPGSSRTVSHDFVEAEMLSSPRGYCQLL